MDLAALAGNYRAIASLAAAEVAGVVKANGYGLGAPDVVRTLHAAGCRTFFAGFSHEAVEIRRIFGDAEIFMDMITIDLNGVPRHAVGAGMWVEIFGPNVPVEQAAEQAGTIPNEILTGIGPRVERIYV